ncbi:MAG: DUF2336 domain-containing protein [Alphaproteobacteria bacterium]|nr:DUF2336 domain-containing protein [Alphaproteobacteria bacterium]
MSTIKESLPIMLALANDRSELSRIQLASMLADVFLHSDTQLTLRETELVDELIDQLMSNSTQQVRVQLVEKFVDVARMPRRIATNLAKESLEVARPVLLSNPSLTDEDLIQIVENKDADYALAIAARARISEAVADALVTTGDVRVMREVAENLGAQISRRALDVVADAARYSVELRKPLLYRPEMNIDVALKLYWWIEQDLRRYSLKRFGISTGQIDEALATTIASFLNDHERQKSNDEVMAQVADWMEEHQAITPQVLPQVLRLGHFRLFNLLLARLSGLSLPLVDMIMGEVGGRGLASICRAIDIDKPSFVSLYLLSRGGKPGDQIVHPRELSFALATFDRMSPAIAQDLLRSWSANPDYFTKHREEAAAEERTIF